MKNGVLLFILLLSSLLVAGCLNVGGENQNINILTSDSKNCYAVESSENTVSGCLVKDGSEMKKCPRHTLIKKYSECLLCNRDIENMHYWSSVDCSLAQN